MPRRVQRIGIAAMLLAAMLLAGCAGTATINKPLPPELLSNDPSGPISRGGYRLATLGDTGMRETVVLLSFSGGGKRSAAFGYGVLRGLRDFPITIDGRQSRLLDQIDVMSSVSGGSFPAAYYALHRDGIFTDFEKDFLNQDLDAYIYGTYLIPWHLGWMFDPNYGTNDRMAEVYDKLMFHGATYADLVAKGRPLISIDATDVDHELAFPFLQNQFDLICSNMASYPLARAVAASNGFPVVFTPITLKSYRSQCGGRIPGWVRADTDSESLARLHQLAQSARAYLDGDRTRYVHLMDGGISDNLAMRAMINTMLLFSGEGDSVKWLSEFAHVRRILLISADGQSENDAATAKQEHLSGLGQIFNAVSGTQIDTYNFETMVLAKEQLEAVRDAVRKERCKTGPIAADGYPCGDVESYFVHLSLAGIADDAERKRLQAIPTGLTIDPADIALLVAAGEQEVKTSPMLAAFRNSLAAK